jgi:hypothetical protein
MDICVLYPEDARRMVILNALCSISLIFDSRRVCARDCRGVSAVSASVGKVSGLVGGANVVDVSAPLKAGESTEATAILALDLGVEAEWDGRKVKLCQSQTTIQGPSAE